MPKKVKRRRKTGTEDDGWEEYYDYVFADEVDENQQKGARIL